MGALKRILFVDDHRALLSALRYALRPQRQRWEMEFVADGNAALAALAERSYDVVVSDLRLPDIDGVRLLDQVRVQYPRTARLMLCAVADQEDVTRAAPVVHQLLPKPFPVPRLESAIEQTLESQERLKAEALQGLLAAAGPMPVVPSTYVELCQAAGRADTDFAKLASIIGRDVGVSARVLQLAGSAYFGHAVQSLEQAVFYLGLELVKALVLSAEVFALGNDDSALPKGLKVSEISAQAVRTVRLVKTMAPEKASEDAVIAALLRDVGTVLMVDRAPDRIIAAALRARRDGRPRTEVERELMGVTHADATAYVLQLWGLPKRIVDAVQSHHEPVTEATDAASAVALASQLIDHVDGTPGELDAAAVDPKWIEAAREI
ncbi:MAG: HDOD domain-containing protein [Myxococcaceae bacterium]|nr:HDOD domain-containing protein [Myxococcaceae bacterium]